MCVDKPDKNRECSTLSAENFKEVISDDSVSDISAGREIYSFKHSMNVDKTTAPNYGFAIIYPSEKNINYKNNSEITSETFSLSLGNELMDIKTCASVEGVHIYSPQHKSSMHLYLSLGYEVAPTCSHEVYQ